MSELGLTPDEIISTISQQTILGKMLVAALTLVTYDGILSFSQEVRCIWQRKFSGATVLYLIIRYGTIVDIFFQLFTNFWISQTILSCKAVVILDYVIDVLCLSGVAVFNCLRIWAICHKSWFPVLLVFVLSMFTPCINIYNYSRPQVFIIVSSEILPGCYVSSTVEEYLYLPVISRAIAVTADIAVLAFTLQETLGLFRTSKELQIKTELSTLLLKNGFFQFFILLILNAIATVLDVLSIAVTSNNAANTSTFFYINQAITSIMLSHFLLDLRSVYFSSTNLSESEPQVSTVQFATMVANMGAPLNASWITGEHEDRSSEVIEYSDHPLSTGLFDTDITNDNGEARGSDIQQVPIVQDDHVVAKSDHIELQEIA